MSDIQYDDPDYGLKVSIRSAERIIKCVDNNDLPTQITDAIANLLILAHEREISSADIMTNAIGHFCATYIEGMAPDEAFEWLNTTLFPWTGERQFAEYAADRAILLAGHAGRVDSPEWGV